MVLTGLLSVVNAVLDKTPDLRVSQEPPSGDAVGMRASPQLHWPQ